MGEGGPGCAEKGRGEPGVSTRRASGLRVIPRKGRAEGGVRSHAVNRDTKALWAGTSVASVVEHKRSAER